MLQFLMSLGIVLYVPIVLCGVVLAIQDFRTGSVMLPPLLGFLLSCSAIGIINRNCDIFASSIFLLIGAIFFFLKREKAFGGADYVIVFAVSFLLPGGYCPLFITSCGVLGILISIMGKKRRFPFIPAILTATLVVKFIEHMK